MRQILSYVSAEPVLWEGTLRDNLTCGKVIEEEKIIEALCAFDFYSAFPDRRVQDILEYLVKITVKICLEANGNVSAWHVRGCRERR